MRTSVQFLMACLLSLGIQAQTFNFTVTNHTGSSLITCANPTISLSASSDFTGTVNYAWVSPSASLTGSSVGITIPGIYTITAVGSNGAITTQTLSIGQNTTAPTSNVAPLLQNINCSFSAVMTVTTTSSANVTHHILAPQGGTFVAYAPTSFYTPQAPGTFTYAAVDNMNGCVTLKTFTVTTADAFPTFSVTSPQNFTLGCNTKSVTSINIINASTTNPPGGPVSYTVLAPGSPTVAPPIISPVSVYTVNIPGTWTVVVRDNNNMCETRVPVSVIQNTFGPVISAIVPAQVLNCTMPQTILQGISPNPNVSYNWTFPGAPGSSASATISVNSASANVTQTIIANYTLTVTDINSTCISTSVIPMYQNLFPPKAMIANGGVSAITCLTPTLMLTNQSSSGIPAGSFFPTNQPVIASLWQGPSPQAPLPNSATYVAATPGVYTMTATDLNNGCTSSTVIVVGDNRIYPVVNNPVVPPPFCLSGASGSGTAAITPTITGSTAGLTYSWASPPNAVVTGANTAVLTTNMVGTYTVTVTNQNGCATAAQMTVIECFAGLAKNAAAHSLSLYPNPTSGLFHIETPASQKNLIVNVYNSIGSLVKSQGINSDKTAIDIQALPEGVYFVKVADGQTTVYTARIVKR